MVALAAVLLGGVGIFLIGMILLTEGLKAAAGDSLRSGLQRFARTPLRGLASGTALTALVQSSSATTLTTIGFVSAGLLTFPQAVGVIFGANLGTTSTGWIVSVLGLRISVGAMALPLVGVGALMRLLLKDRWTHAGTALVGFGLIFVGIDTLQTGMEGLAEQIDPAAFRGDSILGWAVLVVVGVVMTVVMQSSSAAVATTLTALHTGTVGLEQAALLVVGQNMGTTVKAALAAIGGSVPVRRTAAAHILFNLFTGALALVLLPVLLGLSLRIVGEGEPAMAVALFHSLFNLAGVVALFPFLGAFARFIETRMPEKDLPLTGHLDGSLMELPTVAVEAARRAGMGIADELFQQGERVARKLPPLPRKETRVETAGEAVVRLRSFLTGIHGPGGDEHQFARHLSVLHAADHLERFRRALKESAPLEAELAERVAQALAEWREEARPEKGGVPSDEVLARCAEEVAAARKLRRAALLEAGVTQEMDADALRERVDGLLRLDRMVYHAWRAAHHLGRAAPDEEGEGSSVEAEVEEKPVAPV